MRRFTVNATKWFCLRSALLELASAAMLDAAVLRAILGFWLFAALVRCDCLCISFHVFKFIDLNEGKVLRPSEEVRDETLALAAAVPFFSYSYADKFSRTFFATDAMGENDYDAGGYAVVCRKVSERYARGSSRSRLCSREVYCEAVR